MEARHLHRWLFALATIAVAGLAAYGAFRNRGQAQPPPAPPITTHGIIGIPAGAVIVDTRHYSIHSTASPEHAADVGKALEDLYAAYTRLFPIPQPTSKFGVVLYRDRAEFSRHNRSSPWAEAFYDPTAYPVWWLTDATTTRDMPIPLEVLLSGKGGPEVDTQVNQY